MKTSYCGVWFLPRNRKNGGLIIKKSIRRSSIPTGGLAKIILSARLNPVQRLPEESERLWARIETSMERRDKRHRFILFTRYAAACVLILGIVSFWLIHSFQTSELLMICLSM